MYLKVNNEKITPEAAEKLVKLCPFCLGSCYKGGTNYAAGATSAATASR